MNFLSSVLGFIVAIGILVVVHEFGHYIVARACGVKVLRFSIGFGRPLWSRRAADGCEWTIASLPLGGYVKMLDERDSETPIAAADLPRAFNRQSVWRRIAIVLAGPVANFLLAIVLFALVFAVGIREPRAIVAAPAQDTPAYRAGIQGGETIVGLRAGDGETRAVRSWGDLRWQLLDLGFDGGAVSVITRAEQQRHEYRLHLSESPAESVDQDFMSHLGLEPGGASIQVMQVEPGSAAATAGLRAGDRILALDGRAPADVQALVHEIQTHAGTALPLTVERDGRQVSLTVTPAVVTEAGANQAPPRSVGRIGAALGAALPSVTVRYSPIEALARGAQRTWDTSIFSLRMFGRMVMGEVSIRNLSGPVTIADYAGKSARIGVLAFISFLALVSISLGVLNLLPIPMLDGGHLLYYAVEVVTGRTVSERWQIVFQRAGLFCIVALSAVALVNDLTRLIQS